MLLLSYLSHQFFKHSLTSDHLNRRTPINGSRWIRKIVRREARKAGSPPTGLRPTARSEQQRNKDE